MRDDMPDYLAGMLAYWHSIDWRDLPKLAQVDGWVDAHCAHYPDEQDYMMKCFAILRSAE